MPKTKETPIKIGMGCSIFQLGPHWYVRFYDPRKKPTRKKQALKTTDRSEALRLGTALHNKWMNDEDPFDPWEGHATRARHDTTVQEATAAYRADRTTILRENSLEHVAWVVDKFARFCRIEWLSDATPASVRRFVYQAGLAQASRGNYYRNLNLFFNWCVAHLFMDDNPCAKVDRPRDYQPHPAALTERDLDRLLIAIEHHFSTCESIHNRQPNELWMRDAFDLMGATGLRPAELRRLRWGDVAWPEIDALGVVLFPGALHVRPHDGEQTKTGEDRRITMLPRAHQRLLYVEAETRLTSDPSEPVLKGPDGQRAISQKYLSRRFRYFREKAGLADVFDLYSLRHFFATELARRGCSGVVIQKEMGHKNYATTEKYLHLADAERHRATYALFADETGRSAEPASIYEAV